MNYFGERVSGENCGGCDNCLAPRETWDGTVAAQKFLSCVYRIREKNGFGVGIQHVVEVLCGADTEKVRKWRHHALSTYGIGQEHSRAEWAAIGRELVRLGCLRQDADRFNIVELTPEGRAVLKARQKITLTRPVAAPEPAKHRAGEIGCDEALFEKLRQRVVRQVRVYDDVAQHHAEAGFGRAPADFVSRQRGKRYQPFLPFGAAVRPY